MKECIVIYNPNSGKNNKSNILTKLEKKLKKSNFNYSIISTEYKRHAKEIIENIDQTDLIISIGGDGTFNEVMTGNFNRKNKLLLSHIPVGTANDIGAMFGYTKDISKNIDLLLNGQVKDFDVCTINNQPFVYVAGFGKFVNISYETPQKLKKQFGYLAYLIEGVKAFNNQTDLEKIKYTVDGQVYEGYYSFILISNANRIAGIDNFYKEVKLNDHKFEVLLCNLCQKKDIAISLYNLTTKDITKVPGFTFYRTDNIKIEFENIPNKFWSIDGEAFEQSVKQIEIKIVSDIKLLLPTKNIEKLFLKEGEY